MKQSLVIIVLFALLACQNQPNLEEPTPQANTSQSKPETLKVNESALVILGTIQDAGSPQIACEKACCEKLFNQPDELRKVISLGVIDTDSKKKILFEATPDFVSQVKMLKNFCPFPTSEVPDGIFLTHAHIGHYTGLMYLGKEAMNADSVPVFAMPKMNQFLRENGPWSQLVSKGNIALKGINNQFRISITDNLTVIPILVPHRDEYSETVGYVIQGPNKSALFIPDIDKWSKWELDIIQEIEQVDYAFLDATFYDGKELGNRDMAEIPHPFIAESMDLFQDLPAIEKTKIHFIHFNHTNPVLDSTSTQYNTVRSNGFNLAIVNDIFPL